MKPLHALLLAVTLGILVVVMWRAGTDERDTATAHTKRSAKSQSDVLESESVASTKARTRNKRPLVKLQLSEQISAADLQSWLASKQGNAHALGEAQVIIGLLTDNPDLIRQGIEADPNNGHLLFIGATLPAFSAEERLAMSKRFLAADPENAMAAFIHASYLLQAGQSDAAIQMLRGSTERPRMDDFFNKAQLLMDEAYGSVGLSPDEAKLRSFSSISMPHLTGLQSLVKSLKEMENSLPTDQAAELQSLTASMGKRLADQSKSGPLIGYLVGISLEEATLKGLPDDAPSPYSGLTVAEARESIATERQIYKQVMMEASGARDVLFSDPELMGHYVDHIRLTGELEAIQWLHSETEKAK
jgi:hypothetical protein